LPKHHLSTDRPQRAFDGHTRYNHGMGRGNPLPFDWLDGTTRHLLEQVKSLGCTISVRSVGETVEMVAVRSNSGERCVAIVQGGDEPHYRCANELASMVGINVGLPNKKTGIHAMPGSSPIAQ
jgi:hypothetical protein